ncbi:hypothetical protein PR048_021373 [Dryococelus australis]|uniref:Uncharacterized protein n=1 Tax=Dryococelus australis TaxID=614101 RepID=A0ABQ9GY65_9NEOP|nr:hypothetical protein PR048_021373 [Dryococelus australis]
MPAISTNTCINPPLHGLPAHSNTVTKGVRIGFDTLVPSNFPTNKRLVDSDQSSSEADVGLPITAVMAFHSKMFQPAGQTLYVTFNTTLFGRGSAVVKPLLSHHNKPSSIPGRARPPEFSHVRIEPYDATGRWVFSGSPLAFSSCSLRQVVRRVKYSRKKKTFPTVRRISTHNGKYEYVYTLQVCSYNWDTACLRRNKLRKEAGTLKESAMATRLTLSGGRPIVGGPRVRAPVPPTRQIFNALVALGICQQGGLTRASSMSNVTTMSNEGEKKWLEWWTGGFFTRCSGLTTNITYRARLGSSKSDFVGARCTPEQSEYEHRFRVTDTEGVRLLPVWGMVPATSRNPGSDVTVLQQPVMHMLASRRPSVFVVVRQRPPGSSRCTDLLFRRLVEPMTAAGSYPGAKKTLRIILCAAVDSSAFRCSHDSSETSNVAQFSDISVSHRNGQLALHFAFTHVLHKVKKDSEKETKFRRVDSAGPLAVAFQRCSILILIGSQVIDVRSRPSFSHSADAKVKPDVRCMRNVLQSFHALRYHMYGSAWKMACIALNPSKGDQQAVIQILPAGCWKPVEIRQEMVALTTSVAYWLRILHADREITTSGHVLARRKKFHEVSIQSSIAGNSDATGPTNSGELRTSCKEESQFPRTSRIRPKKKHLLGTLDVNTLCTIGQLKHLTYTLNGYNILIQTLQETRYSNEDEIES